MAKSTDNRLKRTTFKLNALLDITLAINENDSTEELIRRFEKLLVDDLMIGKVMMIKLGEEWNCLLNSGFSNDFFKKLSVKNDLLSFNEISFITSEPDLFPEPVDIVIPVTEKDQAISYILIGDIEEEGYTGFVIQVTVNLQGFLTPCKIHFADSFEIGGDAGIFA